MRVRMNACTLVRLWASVCLVALVFVIFRTCVGVLSCLSGVVCRSASGLHAARVVAVKWAKCRC